MKLFDIFGLNYNSFTAFRGYIGLIRYKYRMDSLSNYRSEKTLYINKKEVYTNNVYDNVIWINYD